MTMRFTLPIVPTAQARARHTRTGRAYKAASQLANERTLEAMLMPYTPGEPLEGGIELRFTAYMPCPASESKKRKDAMLRGEIGHTKKPDLDNLAKQLLDAMSRLRFWHDDKQVVRLICEKVYGNESCWLVNVQTICAGR